MPNDLDDFDYSSAAADISGDLGFGSASSSAPAVSEPSVQTGDSTPSTAGAATTPNAGTPPDGLKQPEAWESLPKAWKKEMAEHWQNTTPDVRRYVHDREQQALNGIMQYKTDLDKWNAAVEPVKEYYAQANIDPRVAFQNLANADLALRNAPDNIRLDVLQKLVQDYNLMPLVQQMLGQPVTQPQPPLRDPRVDQLLALEQQRETAHYQGIVDKFLSDPKNEHADTVLPDMLTLIESGQAKDLADAYEKAIWINPTSRTALVQKQLEELTKTPAKPPKQIRSSNTTPAPTGKKSGSIEDTLDEAYQRAMSR